MAQPLLPMTSKWRQELIRPRGPANVPTVGEVAPEVSHPSARFFINAKGEAQVEYGRTVSLHALRGKPVILDLTRVVSDRFF